MLHRLLRQNSRTRRRRQPAIDSVIIGGHAGIQSLEQRVLLAEQVVTAEAAEEFVTFGSELVVSLRYDVTDPLETDPTSLDLHVHYNPEVFEFVGTQNVLDEGDLQHIQHHEDNLDTSNATTNRVSFFWQDHVNGWPGTSDNRGSNVLLGQIRLRALNVAGPAIVNLTAETSDGYDFVGSFLAVAVAATELTVNDEGDVATIGKLTLREAIETANARPQPSIIHIDSTVSSINLLSELPEIASEVTIDGFAANSVTINAPTAGRVLKVAAGAKVNLRGVTLTGGNSSDSGGAILNEGILHLNAVRLTRNRAALDGGAIATTAQGQLTIENSEISSNSAGRDSGAIAAAGKTTVVNSTISGNSAAGNAGGISVTGTSPVTLRNVTLVANNSNDDSAGGGTAGGLLNLGTGGLLLHNTLVVGNREFLNGNGDIPCDIVGIVDAASSGNLVGDPNTDGDLNPDLKNIIGNGAGAELAIQDVVDLNLDFHGATTRTHALTSSIALNNGSNDQAVDVAGSPLESDQRGNDRVINGTVDIGAFESQSFSGDVDGDGEFDGRDSFLIHVVQLGGTNQQILDNKGISTLSSATIRLNISSLGLAADVDASGSFDGNDSFLIHLVQLGGSNALIDDNKGISPLSATEIRANITGLSTNSTGTSRLARKTAETTAVSRWQSPPDERLDQPLFRIRKDDFGALKP